MTDCSAKFLEKAMEAEIRGQMSDPAVRAEAEAAAEKQVRAQVEAAAREKIRKKIQNLSDTEVADIVERQMVSKAVRTQIEAEVKTRWLPKRYAPL